MTEPVHDTAAHEGQARVGDDEIEREEHHTPKTKALSERHHNCGLVTVHVDPAAMLGIRADDVAVMPTAGASGLER